jgi:hypothetical protein
MQLTVDLVISQVRAINVAHRLCRSSDPCSRHIPEAERGTVLLHPIRPHVGCRLIRLVERVLELEVQSHATVGVGR